MNLERLPAESDYEYHKRIINGKLEDKVLADYDYSELAEFVYGKEYSSDVARRMMYGSKRTIDIIESSGIKITSSEEDKRISNRIDDLKKAQQKYYDQRREYNKLINADARTEHLYFCLSESAAQLGKSIGEIYSDVDVIVGKGNRGNDEAVVVFSDWHYGMTADNIFNKYNIDICKERVKAVTLNAIERIIRHGCSKLHVVVLGDLMHGAIHTSARVSSEELACDQLMQSAEILAQSIELMSNYVSNTYVYMTYGNHGRTVQNKNDSVHRDNMERIIPWWLNERMSRFGDSIKVINDFSTEFMLMDVAGHTICAAHGDLDSVHSSPRFMTALFHKTCNKDVEYIILGDKHHPETFNELGVTATICGSLCGADDYASDKRLYTEPSQFMLIVNPDTGVDAEYRLRCE